MKDFLHVKDRGQHFYMKTLVIFIILSLLVFATYEITVYKG